MLRLALIPALFLVLLAGCFSHDQDTVAIAGGRVETVVSANVVKASEAAKAALVAYQQTIVQYTADANHGRIIAYTLTSQRIEIDVTPTPDHTTRIAIRTDGQGGEQISATLMQRIRKEL